MSRRKKLPYSVSARSAKQIREESSVDLDPLKPVWMLGSLDIECEPWGWRQLDGRMWLDVASFLGRIEQMSWQEMRASGCHFVEVGDLSKDARDRLILLKCDDVAELYSLRMKGKHRIWAMKIGSALSILWHDADHTVCPSMKRHT